MLDGYPKTYDQAKDLFASEKNYISPFGTNIIIGVQDEDEEEEEGEGQSPEYDKTIMPGIDREKTKIKIQRSSV